MARRISTPLELKLFDALQRIGRYELAERLRRQSRRDLGLDGDEAVQLAYENVIEEAKRATRGVKVVRPAE